MTKTTDNPNEAEMPDKIYVKPHEAGFATYYAYINSEGFISDTCKSTHYIRADLARPSANVVAVRREVLGQAIDTLTSAKAGLEWYRTENPNYSSNADDEMHQEIDGIISALKSVVMS